MEAQNGLRVLNLAMPDLLRQMENAIQFGNPVLLQVGFGSLITICMVSTATICMADKHQLDQVHLHTRKGSTLLKPLSCSPVVAQHPSSSLLRTLVCIVPPVQPHSFCHVYALGPAGQSFSFM